MANWFDRDGTPPAAWLGIGAVCLLFGIGGNMIIAAQDLQPLNRVAFFLVILIPIGIAAVIAGFVKLARRRR
jgi:hypothetical protein